MAAGKLISIRELNIDIPKEARMLADKMLSDLEKSKRPMLEAVKASLDNAFYNPKVGYLTPGDKVVRTELNVSSVQKLARVVFATSTTALPVCPSPTIAMTYGKTTPGLLFLYVSKKSPKPSN